MKLICLDYDNTYTEFKSLCDMIIDKQSEFGYKVIMCTMRKPNETNEELEKLEKRINVHYSSRQAKRDFLKSIGIEPSIWIDDNPLWIYNDG